MKNVYILTCFIATLALGACGSGDTPAQDNTLSSSTENKSAAKDSTFSDSAAAMLSIPAPGASGTITPGTTPGTVPLTSGARPAATVIPQPKTVVSTGAGLNPEHGKPGHRCDIAVGAPLSTPVQTASTPPVTSPVISSPSVASPSPIPATATGQKSVISTGSGKLNPAHGQPGHDCAIAVGAPLKN